MLLERYQKSNHVVRLATELRREVSQGKAQEIMSQVAMALVNFKSKRVQRGGAIYLILRSEMKILL